MAKPRKKVDKPLGWLRAGFYAALLASIFFALDQLKFFEASDSNDNDGIIQGLLELSPFSNDRNNKNLPAVILFSDEAAKLKNFGWPMQMVDLADWIDVLSGDENKKPLSIFVDIVIRSASHDPAGFCELIERLAAYKFDSGNPDTPDPDDVITEILDGKYSNCLSRTEKLSMYLISQDYEPDYADYEFKKQPLPIIFGASLAYLNAKKNFLEAREKHPLACVYSGHKSTASVSSYLESCNDQKMSMSGKVIYVRDVVAAYIDAIQDWPGVAYLDVVSTLAPISIANDQGRSVNVWVDSANHFSPAYIMACLEKEYSNRNDESKLKCTRDGDFDFETRDLYLLWRAGRGGWKNGSAGLDHTELSEKYLECNDKYDSWWAKLRHLLVNQVSRVMEIKENSEDGKLVRCPYYPTIDLALFNNSNIKFEEIQSVVQGRNVIIGSDLARFHDDVVSPIHGQLPGAFSHATAVDNLMNGQIFTASSKHSEKGRVYQNSLSLANFILVFLVSFSLLKFRPYIFHKIQEWNKVLSSVVLLAWTGICVYAIFNMSAPDPGEITRDYIAMTIVAALTLYSISIQFLKPRVVRMLPFMSEQSKKRYSKAFKNSRKGFRMLFSHVAVICVLYVVLFVMGALVSGAIQMAPPDVIFTFFSILALYMMAAREDVSDGLALFLGEEKISETLLD